MKPVRHPAANWGHYVPALTLPAVAVGVFSAISTAHAQPDYAPAIYRPMSGCTKWHTTGNGHKIAVIHDMEGYYASTISYLNACTTTASIHYMVNGYQDATSDYVGGEITQSVREANYAFHARCWNDYSWGTEHEGFASNPAWYTDAMFVASSGLQRHLANAGGFAKDRNHIVAHGEWQNSAWVTWANNTANMPSAFDPTCNSHTDPGPYWNWTYFMRLVNETNVITGRYWDLNGTTAGAGSTPNGTWDETSTNWSSNANGTVTTGVWGSIADAVFSAGTDATNPYTVTISGTRNVYSLRVNNADVTFSGGKLVFTGFGTYYSNYVSAGHTVTFNTAIVSAGAPDKWGPGTVIYNNASTPKGYFSLNEGTIAIGNNSALGTNKFVIGDPTGANVVTFKTSSSTARTIANNITVNALNFTIDTPGSITFNGDVTLGSSTKNITVNNTSTFNGTLAGTAGVTKLGSGTMVYASTNDNTYSGTTTISAGTLKLQKTADTNGVVAVGIAGPITVNSGGTLLLGASDQIANSVTVTLAGGVFSTAGFDEQMGTLKLTGNSRIDLGTTGSIIKFAASGGVTWTAGMTLTVSNWTGSINGGGSSQLFVGTSAAGLTASQLNQIKFVNPPGFAAGTYAAKILSTGEVVPLAVAPAITAQPQSQSALVGSNALFSVSATGTSNLVYQWRFNGTNLAGATKSLLSLTNVTVDNAGNYSVFVTNIAGSITSTNATLAVYTDASPSVASLALDANGNLTFNVSGVPNYNYVIQQSPNLIDWTDVVTNKSPFSYTNAPTDPAGFYRAVFKP